MKKTKIYLMGFLFFLVSVNISALELKPIQTCTPGTVEYKPEGSCDTTSRKCCGGSGLLGFWSEWGEECDEGSSCGPDQCWDGSECVNKPSAGTCSCTNGTCQVSYTCKIGTGWQKKEVCTCKTGYKKSPYTGQCVHASCLESCSSGSYRRQKYNSDQCECCFASCSLYHNGVCQFVTGACNCMDFSTGVDSSPLGGTCCRRGSAGYIYKLPSTFSSCVQFGQAAYGESNWYKVTCPGPRPC